MLIRSDLRVSPHVSEKIKSCNSSLYALRIMKSHGMPDKALHTVFQSTTLTKLLYCSPAWWGYAKADDRERLEGFLRRSKRFGYCSDNVKTFSELCTDADSKLFKQVLSNSNHVLHALLPPRRETVYNLRPRKHDRLQPVQTNRFTNSNFLTRMLSGNRC